MIKLYCITWGKYRKFEKPKIWYLLEKTLVLSFVYSKCKNDARVKMNNYLKKQNHLRY